MSGPDAAACGNLFSFGDNNPLRAKAFLKNYGIRPECLMQLETPIHSENIILRTLRPVEASPAYLGWLSDPSINTYLEVRFNPPRSVARACDVHCHALPFPIPSCWASFSRIVSTISATSSGPYRLGSSEWRLGLFDW